MLACTDDMRSRVLRRLTYWFPFLYRWRLRRACRQYERGNRTIRDLAYDRPPSTIIITCDGQDRTTRYFIEDYMVTPEDLGHLAAVERIKRELDSKTLETQ